MATIQQNEKELENAGIKIAFTNDVLLQLIQLRFLLTHFFFPNHRSV